MRQSALGRRAVVSGGAVTGTTVIAGGWGLTGAFTNRAADQSSIFSMAGPAVHLVGIPNWIGPGMAGIAIGTHCCHL